MKETLRKNKNVVYILLFLLLFAFLALLLPFLSRRLPVRPGKPPLTKDFVGVYRSEYYNINIQVFKDEEGAWYYDVPGDLFKGTFKKTAEGEYLLSCKYGEEKILFHGKDFTFEKSNLTFKKVSEEFYQTPELEKLRKSAQ